MRIGRFQAKLWPTLGTLLGLSMLLSLGTWQWTRYAQKIVLEQAQAAKIDLPIVDVTTVDDFTADGVDHRRVRAMGAVDTRYLFLIKHRIYREQPGFWIVTPLRLGGDDPAILVNHGWVPYRGGEDIAKAFQARTDHPERFEGLVHVLGYVVPDGTARQRLEAGHDPASEAVTFLETYDIKAIADALPYEISDRSVVLTLDPKHTGTPYPIASYEHVTEPYLTAEKHLGYSITWYSLALALIAMYITHGMGLLGSRHYEPRTS